MATIVGRYVACDSIASGGMATVYVGKSIAAAGYSGTVAIKKLHPEFARDPEFLARFLDEARIAGRIRHTNVVQTLDVVVEEGELFLVLDFVHGAPLSELIYAPAMLMPPPIAAASVVGALRGLHAAHEATSSDGSALAIVHRDVSPQNIMVGADGVARILDFGIAKAAGRSVTTREGEVRGKLAYMAPEQLSGDATLRSDVYAASVVLWEALAHRRLFRGENDAETLSRVLSAPVEPPSRFADGIPPALDEVVLRGLSREPRERFATAEEMANAIEAAVQVAGVREVGAYVAAAAAEKIARGRELAQRAEQIAAQTLLQVEGRPSARRRIGWIVGVAALGVVTSGVLLYRATRVRPPPSPPAEVSASAAEPSSTPPPEDVSAAPEAKPSAPAVPAAAPKARAPTRNAAAAKCNPPYRPGPRGTKVWIPECL